jgi:hypothetical protein
LEKLNNKPFAVYIIVVRNIGWDWVIWYNWIILQTFRLTCKKDGANEKYYQQFKNFV